MRGQKYSDKIKEKALALLAVNNNAAAVAKELGIPPTTIQTWKKSFDAQASEEGNETIAELRAKNKEKFVEDAWSLVAKSTQLIDRRVSRALEREDLIDDLMEAVEQDPSLTKEETKAMLTALSKVKIENLRDVSVVLGTMYDKYALANQEATVNVGGVIEVKKFEDL